MNVYKSNDTAVQWGEHIQDVPLHFMISEFSEGASAADGCKVRFKL